MRKNLISMLDELNLNTKLNISSCSELFLNKDELLHTTSMIPYPVFINGKNYTGARPKILDSEVLMSYIKKYFYKEVKELPNTFIIPLGKSVEEVLELMISEKIIKKEGAENAKSNCNMWTNSIRENSIINLYKYKIQGKR